MAKTKISQYDSTANNNTDINNIDIAEGCAPSGINNAIREMMAQLKNFQTGSGGDAFAATQIDLLAQSALRFQDTTGGEYVAFRAPTTVATNVTWTLPAADGTANQFLKTDGSGALSWDSVAQVYPGAGVAVSTGSSWGTSLTAPSSALVGISDTQTLTNKTISADDNTLSGLAASSFVISDASGNIDGAASQKAIPSGAVVGTTDTQTLTNKTLTSPELTSAPYVNGSYRANIVAVAALDIDCSAGNYFTKTISANSTFTFSSVPASRAFAFTLELTHTSGTVTWPAAVKFPGDTAPTLTTGKTHLFMFVTDDGGTRWRGAALVDYVN